MNMAEIIHIITALLPYFSLIIALISLVKSNKSQKIQDRVNELEMRIHQYELERIEKEKSKESYECVEARVVKISSRQTRLKVWNSGNLKVYNVIARFEDGAKIIVLDNNKMPFDELEPGKSFEVPLITHTGSASKFRITTSWEDKSGNRHEKEQMGDL